ncbi:MAG: Maf family protein [Pseudomonadales bacterium]
MTQLVLASTSPRRADLLSQIGLDFSIQSPVCDETIASKENSVDYVTRMSITKAQSVLGQNDDSSAILAADTIVVVDELILGKPKDRSDGIRMLQLLAGRSHQVMTAVTVQSRNRQESLLVETIVHFRSLTYDECNRYWLSGEPKDKAGGYGIQGLGAIFVCAVNGSYSNVVGLPLLETAELLSKFGIECLPDDEQTELVIDQESGQHG